MNDYIEWDGTEICLENLLIWWGSREPYVHSPGCDDDPRSMHCCEGVYEFESKASISGNSCIFHHVPCIHIDFSDGTGLSQSVEVGDRICYDGEGVFRLEKK